MAETDVSSLTAQQERLRNQQATAQQSVSALEAKIERLEAAKRKIEAKKDEIETLKEAVKKVGRVKPMAGIKALPLARSVATIRPYTIMWMLA